MNTPMTISPDSALLAPAPGAAFPLVSRRGRGWMAAAAALLFCVVARGQNPATTERLALAGDWRFAPGTPAPCFPQAALPPIAFTDTIPLPGTTETAGKGPENRARETGGLTRVHFFEGPAWYQRDVDLPASWAGRHVELRIERTKYAQVWVDDRAMGEQGLYTAAQRYDLSAAATPGRHRLTVMVDNRPDRRPVRGQAHQFDDSAQTNWNGLLGMIELVATPAVWLEDVQAYPDLARRSFRIRVATRHLAGASGQGSVRVQAESFNHPGAVHRPPAVEAPLAGGVAEIELPLGPEARTWDEFSPALYRLTVSLDGPAGHDERTIETGLREFRARDRQFTINGRPTFLRGKHEAGVFPNAGHPPMDRAGWEAYLRIVKDWGFNHLRCHTWVPPEAAFAAADRLGLYLQPELPFWGTFDGKVRDFLTPQADAALRAYGNHPSFVMLTLANEAGGDRAVMNAMVERLRALDPRHLYADGSNNVFWDPQFQPTNDFMVSAKVKPPAAPAHALVTRGSFCVLDGTEGHTQWGPADTQYDYAAALAGLPVPFVAHETGQWTIYPDFAEIAKYTGVTRAYDLERFRASLARHGLLEQARDFRRASGALAAELYREENELHLRTPGCAGFQMLDLQDYPGQGAALVGLLDAFMDSKQIVTPAEFRRACGPVVLLARFDRYVWKKGETYSADLQVAHYGPVDLRGAVTAWTIADEDGRIVARGKFPAGDVVQGGLRNLGRVTAALGGAHAPARCNLEVTLTSGNQRFSQHWPIWIYPDDTATAVPANVVLVRAFDATTRRLLSEGRRVVLIPDGKNWADTLPGGYATDYWCWPMFNNTPGTMGCLIDARHPALAKFPTTDHSERQWTEIARAATPVVLLDAPAGWRPIVQVIDNYERNERLGLIFETRVGAGRLLVCAVDLLAEPLRGRPEARQLESSLLAYAGSAAFAPRLSVDPAALDLALRPSLAQGRSATASSSLTPPWGFVPEPRHAVDGDPNTRWYPAEADAAPWVAVDLGSARAIDTVEVVWGSDEPGSRGTIERSSDGRTWTELRGRRAPASGEGRTVLLVAERDVRFLRVRPLGSTPAARAVRELRVLGDPPSANNGLAPTRS